MTRGAAWLLACLLIGSVLGWQVWRTSRAVDPLPVLYTLGGDFTLDSTLGEPLSLSSLQGGLVLLNFGYTACPDVCPTALARMRDVLEGIGVPERVQPVFVTLDPERDSVDRIAPYLQFFNPRFIGFTGTEAEIAAAAGHYKVFYQREPSESADGYSISHSSHIYLLDGAGRVRATFGEGVPVPDIVATVDRLLSEPADLPVSESA